MSKSDSSLYNRHKNHGHKKSSNLNGVRAALRKLAELRLQGHTVEFPKNLAADQKT